MFRTPAAPSGEAGRAEPATGFQVGDRVRVARAPGEPGLVGRAGVAERVSRTDDTRFSVRVTGEDQLIRLAPADLQFDIQAQVEGMFAQLVTGHPWSRSGGIALRHTGDPAVRSLIVGCGNRPTPERAAELDYGDPHPVHGPQTYTVDPDIELGPTVLGLLGYDPVHEAFLRGNFEAIQFEGYTPLPDRAALEAQPYFLAALDHLLAEAGIVRFTVGPSTDTRVIWATKSGGRLLVADRSHRPWVGRELTSGWLLSRLDELP